MENPADSKAESRMVFATPDTAPYHFKISINQELGIEKAERSFKITGQAPETGLQKTCFYQIPENSHNAYLDFFGQLAGDYGLRLPQNRRPQQAKPLGKIPYREVLRENLHPGILYGYGDPAVIRVNGGSLKEDTQYYLLATSNDAPDSFPVLRSHNLVDWEFVTYVFPHGYKPAWAADGALISDYWAPELHLVNNEFRVYFVARDKASLELCIGMAKSSGPTGPFIPAEEPVLRGNVIDPHIFVREDGTAYLYWKEDNNDVWPGRLTGLLYDHPELITQLFTAPEDRITASFMITLWPWASHLPPMERFLILQNFIEAVIAVYPVFYDRLTRVAVGKAAPLHDRITAVQKFMKTPMFAQPLSANGTTLVGERTMVIQNDLAWEAHLVEGMWVTKQGTKYYLFYAGNDFSTDKYGIGVAIADSPLGPYRKMAKPLVQSTADWWGPGHPSVVISPDGKPVLFLHAFYPGVAGYKQFRALLAVSVVFTAEGVFLP